MSPNMYCNNILNLHIYDRSDEKQFSSNKCNPKATHSKYLNLLQNFLVLKFTDILRQEINKRISSLIVQQNIN